jgi:hypothetical protein
MSASVSVEDLVRSSQFAHGLLFGAAATVVVRVGDTLADRVRPHGRGAGWLAGMAALVPPLAVAGWVLAHHAGLHGLLPRTAVILLAAVGGPLVAVLDSDLGDGRLTALGLTLSAFGIWACVPDTEQARTALGVGLAASVVWALGARRRLGWVAVVGMCLVLAGAIATGARGRPASAIGAAACVSLLALLPIEGRLLARWGRRLPSLPILAGLHAVVVVLASRWVGLMHSTRRATLAALVVLALAAAVTWFTSGALDRARPSQKSVARAGQPPRS